MPVRISKRPAASVPIPLRADVVELFVDTDNVIKFKDYQDIVRIAVAVSGSPLTLIKQAVSPAGLANTDKIYARDAGDGLDVYVKDDDGDEIRITKEGNPAATGGGGMLWEPFTQLKGITGDIPGSGIFTAILPTPLDPPPGVLSQYVVDFRMASSSETDQDWGGFEWTITLVFLDTPGTPDTRIVDSGGGTFLSGYNALGNFNFVGAFVFPGVLPNQINVDSSGVLSLEFLNAKGNVANGAFVINVAGPFIFPALAAAPPPPV